jgi:vacuolar iron transporter family protein
MARHHRERHRTGRIGWLRAAVLGANDGIVSTASLVLGVAAAQATHSNIVVAGVAGLVAGAMSMAAGEYVSVQSQADTEQAELARERLELHADTQGEHEELMAIYIGRGLEPALARQVAEQLMAHDALGAHSRAPEAHLIPLVSGASLAYLALLGGVAACVGGARVTVGALRVTFWGALAMGLTAGVGALFGTGA